MDIDFPLLLKFIPTAFLVSFLPGMCMTLALALGISIGFRMTLWMMLGELLGVAIVCAVAIFSGTLFIEQYSEFFYWVRWLGAGYLVYLGIMLWFSKGSMAIPSEGELKQIVVLKRIPLAIKGFVIALSNPKGWLLSFAIFPPFINEEKSILFQGVVLMVVFLLTEFTCLCIYTLGGRTLRKLLLKPSNIQLMNRMTGFLIGVVGIWLIWN